MLNNYIALGLPLTPESPDDDVAVARKAAEIIRESEEQSMLSFSKDDCAPKDRYVSFLHKIRLYDEGGLL